MRRDVDFARLRALPGRRVVAAQPGERVVRRGAGPTDLFVVVSGQVRLEVDGREIARLGPAELFGEVGLVGGAPHPYDAIATSATTLLAIPTGTAEAELAQAGKLAHGLAQTLADRALQLASVGPSPTDAASSPRLPAEAAAAATAPPASLGATEGAGLSLLGGLDLPPPPWEAERQAAEKAPVEIDKSVPRPEAFWKKSMKCPICGQTFGATQVRDNYVEVASRDSDLYEHHRGINTLHYAVPVCPRCRFAAFPDDFNRLTTPEQEAVRRALEAVQPKLAGLEFGELRDAALARTAFELAILCYGARRPQRRKVASLYHRLAWLARAAGSADQERALLATARDGYVAALEKNEAEDPRTEIVMTYLVADLSRRLSEIAEAGRWVSMVLQHPQIDRHKMIAELARDLHGDLRAARARG